MVKIKTRSCSTSSASASSQRKIGLAGDTKKAARKKTARKKVSRIDALKPKKPPTAFFYFMEDFRKEYRDANPNIKSMRDIGKACGEKWKTMTYEEKVKYYDIATEKRAEFDIAMTNFTKKKESGEFDEDDLHLDDDSDFDG
ncbi:high mobility group B protein 14-like [Salvia splendens]|uniref:high mobility group B protein 14-like n=1 Tax=Salvia splendens TaxID=180675 RepID=UPI00110257D7|nr:high mobility group B protein 14-like [Salvia splendens]XP_042043032.1 high mobility group B protein 14-like [Salvia splendens]